MSRPRVGVLPALVLGTFLACATSPAAAQASEETPEGIDRFLTEWAERMQGLRTLEIRFRQEKRLKILRRPLVSQGTIRMSIPEGRLRVVILDPAGKLDSEIYAEPDSVRIYYPALARVEVYPGGAGAAPPVLFPGLGGDLESLRRDYRLSLTRAEGHDRLTLIPRNPSSPVREMELVLSGYQVKELRQVHQSGDSVRIEIEEWKKNPPLDPEELKLRLPPGVQEVRPLEKRRKAAALPTVPLRIDALRERGHGRGAVGPAGERPGIRRRLPAQELVI